MCLRTREAQRLREENQLAELKEAPVNDLGGGLIAESAVIAHGPEVHFLGR
jgi:hypothetical protein